MQLFSVFYSYFLFGYFRWVPLEKCSMCQGILLFLSLQHLATVLGLILDGELMAGIWDSTEQENLGN